MEYPVEIINRVRVRRVCNSKEEAIDHLFNADTRFSLIENITAARTIDNGKITPDNFIAQRSNEVLRMYSRYKRYGAVMFDGMPNAIAAFFDTIQDVIDKHEQDRLKRLPNGNINSKNSRTRSKDQIP